MIEIIARGRVPQPTDKFKVACGECGSILRFERKDTKPATTMMWDETLKTNYVIVCPVCNFKIRVKEKDREQ